MNEALGKTSLRDLKTELEKEYDIQPSITGKSAALLCFLQKSSKVSARYNKKLTAAKLLKKQVINISGKKLHNVNSIIQHLAETIISGNFTQNRLFFRLSCVYVFVW